MESTHLRLEALTVERIPELFSAISIDPEVYQWLPFSTPSHLDEFTTIFQNFIDESAIGKRVAFAVILKSTGLAIGTTSFLDLNPAHKSLEIGSTFYAKDYWRSFVNTECKLMMLSEAFDTRGVEKVTLKTDSMNQRSRNAILRLGASYEGILRHHMLRPNGTWRDSAYFSILKEEWPTVKADLLNKLESAAGK
jgi:RimJ/RimL family protein N-acetyltransferase